MMPLSVHQKEEKENSRVQDLYKTNQMRQKQAINIQNTKHCQLVVEVIAKELLHLTKYVVLTQEYK